MGAYLMSNPSKAQQIACIANTSDEDIDYQDAPALPKRMWQRAVSVKKAMTQSDADTRTENKGAEIDNKSLPLSP